MPRACTVCTHPERPAIDQALQDGVSYRHIAQHCGVSASSLVRHVQHWTSSAPPEAARVPEHVAPCTCPCTRIDWPALQRDVQRLTALAQDTRQDPYGTLYSLRCLLPLLEKLTASACAQR